MSKDDIKIRKSWPNKNDFDPSTKIERVKTSYQRHNNKKAIEEALQEAEEDSADLDFGF
jgi:hypothetical protein